MLLYMINWYYVTNQWNYVLFLRYDQSKYILAYINIRCCYTWAICDINDMWSINDTFHHMTQLGHDTTFGLIIICNTLWYVIHYDM